MYKRIFALTLFLIQLNSSFQASLHPCKDKDILKCQTAINKQEMVIDRLGNSKENLMLEKTAMVEISEKDLGSSEGQNWYGWNDELEVIEEDQEEAYEGENSTVEPTEDPTEEPTEDPTEEPTEDPTEEPTEEPTSTTSSTESTTSTTSSTESTTSTTSSTESTTSTTSSTESTTSKDDGETTVPSSASCIQFISAPILVTTILFILELIKA